MISAGMAGALGNGAGGAWRRLRVMEFFCYHRDRAGSAALRAELREQHWYYMDGFAAELIARATSLRAIGRAGVGVDNVDVEAATKRGIVVANAPQSNVVTAAEHTLALLLALARNIPQAYGSLIAGKWDRSKYSGVELYEKTLGILGYSAAKEALVNLMRNYASILGPHRIRVNAIQPTGVNTPMIHNQMLEDHFATATEQDNLALVNAIPVDAVEPADISNAMLWLCSEEARYVTGSAIRVDAGANLR